MGLFDIVSQKAKEALDAASKAASAAADAAVSAGKAVVDTTSEAASAVADAAVSAGKVVADTASEAASAVADTATSVAMSSKDVIAEFTAQKVKGMIRGLDLDATIEALNKHQKEAGADTKELTGFVMQLKIFSEDGIISADEKESLRSKAKEAGISDAEFEQMLPDGK